MTTIPLDAHEQRSTNRAGHVDGLEIAQWEYEIETLGRIYQMKAPRVVVELGVYQGGTLWYWLKDAAPGALVIGIDKGARLSAWDRWVKPGTDFEYIQGDTHEEETVARLMELLDGRLIDFLFIDADHTEEGVTLDYELYSPLVAPDGFIAFHDILDPAPGRGQDHIRVSLLWKRIRQAGHLTMELIAHPDQEWGGIGVMVVPL